MKLEASGCYAKLCGGMAMGYGCKEYRGGADEVRGRLQMTLRVFGVSDTGQNYQTPYIVCSKTDDVIYEQHIFA